MPLESEIGRSSKPEVHFLSSHEPDPLMVRDLGGTITARIRGGVKDVHRQGDQIAFTETLLIGGDTIKVCHLIPVESIVVIDASILLQKAWLDAGVQALLVPQIKQEVGRWRGIKFKYYGLLQVHRIEVVTSQWTAHPDDMEKPENQTNVSLDPIAPDTATGQVLSLLNFFGLNPAKHVSSH